jgi:chloramphenicol 3-O phosphotransferase
MSDGCYTWVINRETNRLIELQTGSEGLKMLSGVYKAIAAFSSEENNVIIDDVIFDVRVLRKAVEFLHESRVFFIGIYCQLDIAEEREKDRGDRHLGLVKAHYDLVHSHSTYNLTIDTSAMPPVECAMKIKAFLESGVEPTALTQLAATFAINDIGKD